MKRIDMGQTIGILANLGVLVGILLLVYELNQNRQMMRSQTRSDISNTLVDVVVQQANSSELSGILVKLDAGEQLTPVETQQFYGLQTAYWRYRENVNYQYRNGLYEEREYLAQREAWVRFVDTHEIVRAHWCSRQPIVSPDFFLEINSLIAEPCEV